MPATRRRKRASTAKAAIGGTWDFPGADRWWLSLNFDLLVPLESRAFADGTWHLRAIGWRDGGGGTLTDRRVIPICGLEQDNDLVLTFDNQVATVPGLHDATHDRRRRHPLLHRAEPDTHILAVRINGVPVGPCDTVDASSGVVEIADHFMARDTAAVAGQPRHLGSYTLQSRWGLSQSRDLLSQPSASVSVLSGGPSGWAGGSVRPATTAPRSRRGRARPTGPGGTFRLTMQRAGGVPRSVLLSAVPRGVAAHGGGQRRRHGRVLVHAHALEPHAVRAGRRRLRARSRIVIGGAAAASATTGATASSPGAG